MDFVWKLYGNTYAVHVTVALVGVATLNVALPPPPDHIMTWYVSPLVTVRHKTKGCYSTLQNWMWLSVVWVICRPPLRVAKTDFTMPLPCNYHHRDQHLFLFIFLFLWSAKKCLEISTSFHFQILPLLYLFYII